MNKKGTFLRYLNGLKKDNIIPLIIDVLFFISTFCVFLFNGNRFVYLIWIFFVPLTILLFFELFLKKGIVIDGVVLVSGGLLAMMLVSYILNGFDVFNTTNVLMIVLFNVFYQYFIYRKNSNIPINLLFISLIAFVIVVFIMNFKNIIAGNIGRLGGEIGNVNSVGVMLSIGFSFSLFFIFFKRKYIAGIPGILFFALALFTGSKVALLIIVLSVIAAIFLFFGKKRVHYSLILIIVVGIVFWIILYLPAFATIKIRIKDLMDSLLGLDTRDASTLSRKKMIKEALLLFIRKPLVGWGFEGFRFYGGFGTYSHSTFSEVLANFGIISFLLLEFLVVSPLLAAIKNIKSEGKNTTLPIILGIVLLISQIATMVLGAKFLYLIIATLNGLVFSYKDRKVVLVSKDIFKGFKKP